MDDAQHRREQLRMGGEEDASRLLNQLPVWAPDAAIRRKILVENPARLYAF